MLNHKLQKNLYIVIAVITGLLFAGILSVFMRPMEDASYDLSLIPQGEHTVIDIENFDEKGWNVYTREGDIVTPLIPTGTGSYTGIELGQTLYFSRVMEEELDSPTLQLGTAERQFVVFLDEEVLYTDCPQLNNRIGFLQLPMNDYAREDPIIITLPQNYQGKTLTIAQSTPAYSETSSVKAYPCSVRLYCGYSYESGLIAESFSTALLAALVFAIGVGLLVFFVHNRNIESLCMALVAFLWMTVLLLDTSFFYHYFGYSIHNNAGICHFLAVLSLLVFMARHAGKYRKVLWFLMGLYGVSLLIYFAYDLLFPTSIDFMRRFLRGFLTEWIAVITFGLILVFGMLFWKKESLFYRLFSPLCLGGLILYWAFLLITDTQNVVKAFPVTNFRISYFYNRSLPLIMGSALIAALIEAIRREWQQRTEKRLLEERREMTQVTYESMCSQHEEVMKLRHDMTGHLETLRSMNDRTEITAYIDNLIGKNNNVRLIVHTGNEVLDIILNSKLSAAIDAGIKVEIVRSTAPRRLPIPDNDLSSIVINILNNAIAAARSCEAKEPFLTLDIHIKDSWLAIVCKNSADIRQVEKIAQKETVPKHGLGLKIIEETVKQYNGLFDTEYGADFYKVNVILPLD